jgi:O-methyltransferase
MAVLKTVAESVVVPTCRKVGFLRRLVTGVSDQLSPNSYDTLKRRFVENGHVSKWDARVRESIVARFEEIHRAVPKFTKPMDGLVMAEALLSMEADGAIVECGCYAGSSTAKLSVVAKIIGKPLYVFDSFEGLPTTTEADGTDFHSRLDQKSKWVPGTYGIGLAGVKANVERYGEPSVCTYHKGWFSDTLTPENLPEKIAFAFTDVDLASSARDCIRAIWPRLSQKGVYFSHDVAFIKVLQALLDERLWRDELGEFPPILFGAGYGIRDAAPHLGYMVKGSTLPPEYLNKLTLEKAAAHGA